MADTPKLSDEERAQELLVEMDADLSDAETATILMRALRSARLEGRREMQEKAASLGYFRTSADMADAIRALDPELPETPNPAACSRSPVP